VNKLSSLFHSLVPLHKLWLVLVGALITLMACTTSTEPPPTPTGSIKQDATKHTTQQPAPVVTDKDLHNDEIVVTARKRSGRMQEAPMSLGSNMAYESFDMVAGPAYPLRHLRAPSEPINRENYAHVESNPIKLVSEEPVSTFSIDVDTAAYANVRRMLNAGQLPPQDAVRVEEMINYFSYDYTIPRDAEVPFSINMEIATSPWNPHTQLLQVGLKGFEVEAAERPAANLVFLVDVSGSMQDADKLPLLKNAFRLLIQQLDARDSVALVVYAGATGIVLQPTAGDQKATILSSLDQLTAGGRTNGAAGINLAYQMAEQAFIKDGINRVILATDGDFNVGTVSFEALVDMVEERRNKGISLTTLGFGTGNYNDHLMEQLADEGNGNYAYIDGLNEARKVLVEELTATLQTIAKDVKIQIEFNPDVVAEYRLIGYENRMLRREDFNNDKIDAGEIGAGHTVTALYEISLVGSEGQRVDPLRYGQIDNAAAAKSANELAFVRLRYKEPGGNTSKLIEKALRRDQIVELAAASDELLFAAAVAAFGQQLRGGDYLEDFGYAEIVKLAQQSRAGDPFGYRGEFISLVNLADSLAAAAQDRVAAR
jgi:Ca-activated chloride channel family protein